MSKRLKILLLILLAAGLLLLVGPFLVPVPALAGLQPPEALAGEDSAFVTIPFAGTDDIDIHYVAGDAGALNIVLLHGFASNLYTWDKVFDAFTESGAVVAHDRPPFGLSERLLPGDWAANGPNPYTTEAAVDRLLAFMDAQGMEQALLVGNSAGGLIALQAAQSHPERVLGLILADPAVYTSGASPLMAAVANLPQVRRLGPLVARAFFSNASLLDLAYHDPTTVSPETQKKAAVSTQVEDWDSAFWEFTAAATSAAGVIEQIPATTTPTLVITGDDDRIVPPEESARLAEELPNAELAILPACGHVPQDECPAPFMEAVAGWLAQQPFATGR